MTKSYSDMTIEELQTCIKEIEKEAMSEYKVWAKKPKADLLMKARQMQRITSCSEKSSKDELIMIILEPTHYTTIYHLEKILKSKQSR